jgi:hypothetical protein
MFPSGLSSTPRVNLDGTGEPAVCPVSGETKSGREDEQNFARDIGIDQRNIQEPKVQIRVPFA